jgi:hypothetical protein
MTQTLAPAARAQDDPFSLLSVRAPTAGTYTWPSGMTAGESSVASSLTGDFSSLTSSARRYTYGTSGINVLILGDGYTSAEYSRYSYLANRAAQAVYGDAVVREAGAVYKIRFYPYFLASAQSGASSPSLGHYRSTALGASYFNRYRGDTSIKVDFARTWAVARSVPNLPVNYVLVLVNAGQYAATHWASGICVVSDFERTPGNLNPATFEDIVRHEMLGHTIGGLWDEYVYNGQPSADVGKSPNCDASSQYPKWSDLIGWQWTGWQWTYVGAYKGCAQAYFYRPTSGECRMGVRAAQPFCAVCRRHVMGVFAWYR